MISDLLYALTTGARKIFGHPRILFIVILAVVFPILLLFLANQFLSVGTENFETLERSRAGIMHDAVHGVIASTNGDTAQLQAFLTEVAEKNADITKFRIAKLTRQNEIILLAALDESRINEPVLDEEAYHRALLTSGTPITFEFVTNEILYWQTFSAYTDDAGEVWFVLTEQSFESFANVVAGREWLAYALLGLVYVFLLGLAYWQIKDIDYRAKFKRATQQLHERDQFANVIAHELRSPLTAIRGYASLIEETPDVSEQVRSHVTRVRESTERQVRLVNDFLEVARLQSGSFKIDLQETNLPAVLQKICDELQPLVKEKDLILRTDLPSRIEPIQTDGTRIEQILTNIVSNAVKYTKEGSVDVVLIDRDDILEIRVKDTGVGISAENQKKLFAPFYRVENSDTKKITGTGLGMWITKRLVEHLGGTIGIESIQDVGTNVVIKLPKTPPQHS